VSPRRSRGAAGLLVAVCLWGPGGCSISDSHRFDFMIETLRERAEHLGSAERREIARGLIRAERKTGVDAFLLLALMEEESHFKQRARSRRGALGLLQVLPETGREVAQRNRISWKGEASLFLPSVNIFIGAAYLAELREQFDDWDVALTAYNHGPTKARELARRGRKPSSRFAARVLRRFESLRQAAEAARE